MPPTSQLDWLSSTTAIIVLFWSRATRDLLRSFGWGIAALHRLDAATKLPRPRRPPHSISPVPRSRERTSGSKSDLQEKPRPKHTSGGIRLLITRLPSLGAHRTSHLGIFLLRHFCFDIGRRVRARGAVRMTFVSSVHYPKIMLGMLVKVFCSDSIATRRCLSSEGNVTFENLMRVASELASTLVVEFSGRTAV